MRDIIENTRYKIRIVKAALQVVLGSNFKKGRITVYNPVYGNEIVLDDSNEEIEVYWTIEEIMKAYNTGYGFTIIDINSLPMIVDTIDRFLNQPMDIEYAIARSAGIKNDNLYQVVSQFKELILTNYAGILNDRANSIKSNGIDHSDPFMGVLKPKDITTTDNKITTRRLRKDRHG